VPNAHSAKGTKGKPGILLLEEYGALAAAISSALKKFAPRHSTHVARSLKELEALAEKIRPELLMIDVDPPWPKLTQLLGKLRTEYPEARVLVIGATIPSELIENRGSHRALHFLEKPFDVAELGAAVQALLGPWKEAETESLRGTLRSFSAVDAALLQCASGRTVVVEVKKSGGKTGELHFVDGQLFHVENGKRAGVEALEELFSWSQPEMREKEKRPHPGEKRTIPMPWTEAFLEALQKVKRQRPAAIPAAALSPEMVRVGPRTGKKIVVVDDTEMLLIFVEDVLATADPELQITTASNGLSGVKEIERAHPDLVLLDFSLPDFDGHEVCRRLLENEPTSQIPILMMSGHIPEMTRAAAVLENVVATIEKPFLSEALVALVQQTLQAGPQLQRKKASAAAKPLPKKPARPESPPPAEPPRPQRTGMAPVAPVAAEAPRIEVRAEPAEPVAAAAAFLAPTENLPAAPIPAPAPPPPVAPAPAPVFVQPAAPPEEWPPVAPPAPRMEPPVHQIPRPGIMVDLPSTRDQSGQPRGGAMAAPVLSDGMNEVVLGIFLEVVSMQLTPMLRMGTIRARPSSLTASLHVASPALRAALPANGFQLGALDLDRTGRIAVLRLIPTVQPFVPLATRSALQIGGVSVVPTNSHESMQLTSTVQAPMRMHLLARLEVAGVELSSTFQISQLVLKSRSHQVRVTLSEQAVGQEQSGTLCEIAGVQMDGAARLAELTLNPVT
jgi:DNA-binding response OmpR family regulator